MATLNGVGRTAIDPGDLHSFDGPPKYQLIRGPAQLYRFGRPRGKWWFDTSLMTMMREDFYESIYGDGPRQKDEDGTRFPRYALAVSREWNKFHWMSALTLKAGEDIDCFIGPIAPQPEWDKKKDGPMLGGGLLQYVVYEMDKVPSGNLSEMSTMALWRKWSR